jgi:hypothetical protein
MERLDRCFEACLPLSRPFALRAQHPARDYLLGSRAGRLTIAESYVGLPLEDA